MGFLVIFTISGRNGGVDGLTWVPPPLRPISV